MTEHLLLIVAIVSLGLIHLFAYLGERSRSRSHERMVEHLAAVLGEQRRSDYREQLASDRILQVLIEKMQMDPERAMAQHIRARAAEEANQSQVLAEEIRSKASSARVPRQRSAEDDGVEAQSLEAAQE